ncbi:hypothetical protein QVD17_36518 [Tagetes erecta]|uniref:Uncharacterized protein n=1 Tax=Tagetes erecta TaxID=13708 RepID=A0AAD8JSW2_TARER|nr:hypothetical protein QVD17_36518 [Tagetes erecta]
MGFLPGVTLLSGLINQNADLPSLIHASHSSSSLSLCNHLLYHSLTLSNLNLLLTTQNVIRSSSSSLSSSTMVTFYSIVC